MALLTKEELQAELDAMRLEGEPSQIVLSIEKYSRAGNPPERTWVESRCSEHGLCNPPIRLAVMRKRGCGCSACLSSRRGREQSRRKALRDGSLLDKHPDIAAEWHHERYGRTPDIVPVQSNMKVSWQCRMGHIWPARIADRVGNRKRGKSGSGCPFCTLHSRISKVELKIYSELKEVFGSQIRSQAKIGRWEVDLLLSSARLVIEVDGYPWHLDTKERDLKKQDAIISEGFELIRVRDDRLEDIYEHSVRGNVSPDNPTIIRDLAGFLLGHKSWNREQAQKLKSLSQGKFSGEALFTDLMVQYPLVKGRGQKIGPKPLTETHPHLIDEWGDNGLLEPHMVSANAKIEVKWNCPRCGSEYSRLVHDRSVQKYGCGPCATELRLRTRYDARRKSGENLADKFPELAQEFDIERNGKHPRDVSPKDGATKYWWNCSDDTHEPYQALASSRTARGDGCPYCSGHRPSSKYNLRYFYPDVVHYWDYEKNLPSRPEDFTPGSYERVHWKCPRCSHTWKQRARDQVNPKTGKVRIRRHKCAG